MSLERKNQYSSAQSHANRRSGEMGLANGFESRSRHHMWVEVTDGYLPCSGRFFSGFFFGFQLSLETLQNSSSV